MTTPSKNDQVAELCKSFTNNLFVQTLCTSGLNIVELFKALGRFILRVIGILNIRALDRKVRGKQGVCKGTPL